METIRKCSIAIGIAVLCSALGFISCGKNVDLQNQMSGVWVDRISQKTVELRLAGESKTVSLEGHQYPVVVNAINEGKGEIRLNVNNGSGAPEVWVLSQNWEDADRFNIILERGREQKEVLIPKQRA